MIAHLQRGEVKGGVAAVVDGEEVHDALEEDVDHDMVEADDGHALGRVAVDVLVADVSTDFEQGGRRHSVAASRFIPAMWTVVLLHILVGPCQSLLPG